MYAFDTIVTEADRSVRVLLVQAAIGQTIAEVMEDVRQHRPGEDPLIVRLPVETPVDPATWHALANPTASVLIGNIVRVVGRTRSRSVHVLSSFAGIPYLTAGLNAEAVPDELASFARPALLDRLREAEFAHLVQRSKALLTAPPESMFRAPSGYLVQNFVRVGNIQADRDALDAVAFWMLKHLEDRDAIVIDTWSISSIAFNSSRVAGTYFGRSAPRVEMLPGYSDGSEIAPSRTRKIFERVASDVGRPQDEATKVLILISATQSGGLALHLGDVCKTANRAIAPTFLALFALHESDVPRLSDMVDDKRFMFEPARPSRPTVVEIDPQIYFPLTYVDVPYRLAKADAERHREFFDAYANTNMVKVHADESRSDSGDRHHAVRLDLDEILATGRFSTRLKKVLDAFDRQRAILAPSHAVAQRFARIVAGQLKPRHGPTPILPIPGLETLSQTGDRAAALDLLRHATTADEFIVLDDFSADTARMAQIDKHLRTLGFLGRINYLVGIQTYGDSEEWAGFVGRLVRRDPPLPRHTVHAIEAIPLEDQGRNGCPWCDELALYDKWVVGGQPLPAFLELRRSRLVAAGAEGLSDDALVHPLGLARPELGPRSFYVKAGCTQAHVFAAASAALQTLRTIGQPNKPKLGPRHFPIATVLHHEDYLNQKWTDTVLRAAFLRAGTLDELAWTQAANRTRRKEALAGLLRRNAQTEHDVVLEILIAAACGKVELDLDDEQLSRVVASRTPDGSAAYIMERLKERRR